MGIELAKDQIIPPRRKLHDLNTTPQLSDVRSNNHNVVVDCFKPSMVHWSYAGLIPVNPDIT